jgi:hypothetical protein
MLASTLAGVFLAHPDLDLHLHKQGLPPCLTLKAEINILECLIPIAWAKTMTNPMR